MIALGLDIGSRSVEAVWIDDAGTVVDSAIADSGYDPIGAARSLVVQFPYDMMVATGYGRRTAHDAFGCGVITEIKAYATGASTLFPEARSVLDIGGQDTKVIALGSKGKVLDFEMNDKCAAGTGKFLEVMAKALGFSLEEMAQAALDAPHSVTISSMCTVFAENEVTGLVHRGENRKAIARGIHEAIVKRTISSLRRIGAESPLVFAGGVAKNAALVAFVREQFSGEVLLPQEPQLVGAFGAALVALNKGR